MTKLRTCGGQPPPPPSGRRQSIRREEGGVERGCTYRLADDGVFDPIDAAGEHGKGQSRVEAEVEERVPSLPTDPDRTERARMGLDGH